MAFVRYTLTGGSATVAPYGVLMLRVEAVLVLTYRLNPAWSFA